MSNNNIAQNKDPIIEVRLKKRTKNHQLDEF
jgi:hypothetical protein